MDTLTTTPLKSSSFNHTAREISHFWRELPDKAFFFVLVTAWLALFHFLGNSTFGYTNTPSLFGWMKFVFSGSAEESHGFLIPLAVLALFYWKRKTLLSVQKQVWWPALGMILLALFLHVLGFLVQQTRISIVAFFLGLYGLTGLVWGREWLKETFFPFFLFGFCVPIAAVIEPVTVPLRAFAAKISTSISHLLGIDVISEGTQIFNAAHTFQYEVAAACSGLRSLIAIMVIAIIYAFVAFEKKSQRALLIVAAVPLAIAGNVLRLLAIIVSAEMFGQNAGNYVHENTILSLLPYVPAVLGLLFLGRFMARKKPMTMPVASPAL
jgi:exosortase